MNFSELLAALRDNDLISIPLLYQLTDLQGEELTQFTEAWKEFEPEKKRMIMRHLSDLTEDSYLVQFDPLFYLGIEDEYPPVRMAAVDGIWQSENTRFVQPLVEMAEGDSDISVRATAAATLGQYLLNALFEVIPQRFKRVILPALWRLLDDDDTVPMVKLRALESASQSSDDKIHQYIELFYASPDLESRLAAVRAMGNSGGDQWLPTILEELESKDAPMRLAAANAAGAMGDPQATSFLIDLIDDIDPQVQIAAIYALGAVGGKKAASVLREILKKEDENELRQAAEESLEEIEAFSTGINEYLLFDADDEENLEDEFNIDGDWDTFQIQG